MKINGFISIVMLTGLLLIIALGDITHAQDATDWMPDPNLRQVISEKLGIKTLTIIDMKRLHDLVSIGDEIESLQGLEHAVHLNFLHISGGNISDLTPLSGLLNLQTLKLEGHQIVDISPLAKLRILRELLLEANSISDLTPLSGLINLEYLRLHNNRIVDISPLSNLTQLEYLELQNNQISDFTPLLKLTNLVHLDIRDNPDSGVGQFVSADPTIIEALRVRICEFEKPTFVGPVKERIENRDYPSPFSSQVGIVNTTDLEPVKHIASVDLSFGTRPFHDLGALSFAISPFGGYARTGDVQTMKQHHAEVLRENPNMLTLAEIRYYDGHGFEFRTDSPNGYELSEDSPYWLRNSDGSIAKRIWYRDAQGNEHSEPLVDFTQGEVQEMIIDQAVAVANCGLYDGIWLDRWTEDGELHDYVPPEIELTARTQILQRIRARVPDDFLILVNATWNKIPHSALHVNGVLIETWASADPDSTEFVGEHYTHEDFRNYEESLIWNEANLREPNFTLLDAKRPSYANPQSPKSRQTMRTFTTLSLTHSDGYVGGAQIDYGGTWYDFWNAPLGQPIGEKGQLYENREGLFIREFTNGWAVYNRSGAPQVIRLPEQATGVESGLRNTLHILPDLDGEIYLKKITSPTDVNADGIVNILDLVAVANAFGKDAPDVNGDGTVNVLDLVAVANAFE